MKYPNGETYVGGWQLNARQGKGRWTKKGGDVIEARWDVRFR